MSFIITGNAGAAGVSVAYSGVASGSVTSGLDGSYLIPNLAAGAYTITPVLAGYTFSPASANKTIVNANIAGVNFTAARTGATASSVVDSRIVPNSTLNVQDTKQYTVEPTDSRTGGPVVDSRTAGAPVDSRTILDRNSRK